MRETLVPAALLAGLAALVIAAAAPLWPTAHPGVDVRVVSEAGAPLVNAFVSVMTPDRKRPRTVDWEKTGRDGIARFRGLNASRRYTLVVEPPPELKPDVVTREFPDWAPGDRRVELAVGREITGRVQDVFGRPLQGWVGAEDEDPVATRTDGTFRLEHQTSRDAVRLAVYRPAGSGRERACVAFARPGDTDVVLVVPGR